VTPPESFRAATAAVAVTLALSVTMLLIVMGVATQTLFHLTQHTLLLREVTHLLEGSVFLADDGCDWFEAAVGARYATAEVACDSEFDRLSATVTNTAKTRYLPAQTVDVVAYRGR